MRECAWVCRGKKRGGGGVRDLSRATRNIHHWVFFKDMKFNIVSWV